MGLFSSSSSRTDQFIDSSLNSATDEAVAARDSVININKLDGNAIESAFNAASTQYDRAVGSLENAQNSIGSNLSRSLESLDTIAGRAFDFVEQGSMDSRNIVQTAMGSVGQTGKNILEAIKVGDETTNERIVQYVVIGAVVVALGFVVMNK